MIDEIDIIFYPTLKVYFKNNLAYQMVHPNVFSSFAPFPSQPDILSCGKFFCGITYYIPHDYIKEINQWADAFPSKYIRVVDVREKVYYNFNEDYQSFFYLEINWNGCEPDNMIFACLSEDTWYFSKQNNMQDNATLSHAIGINLYNVSEIGLECGLKINFNF